MHPERRMPALFRSYYCNQITNNKETFGYHGVWKRFSNLKRHSMFLVFRALKEAGVHLTLQSFCQTSVCQKNWHNDNGTPLKKASVTSVSPMWVTS